MQLHVYFKIDGGLELPVHYRHILQAAIYRALTVEPSYAAELHDRRITKGERPFKFFTYSDLKGKYEILSDRICFIREVSFEVRSPKEEFILRLRDGLDRKGLILGRREISEVYTRISRTTIRSGQLRIRMKTPICVYSTDPVTHKTYFYTPEEQGFYDLVQSNFIRKYRAFSGGEPEELISLQPVYVHARDKIVTKYKNFYYSGWKGEYILSGPCEYLDFLFQTGIGAKNAQGFGMFEVMK